MPKVTIRDIGLYGVIQDIAPYELPPEAWSSAMNVSFADKKVVRTRGETKSFGATSPPIIPYYLFSSPDPSSSFWMLTNTRKVYCVSNEVYTDITRVAGDYTGTVDNRWNGTWLNGVHVLNNGIDLPQQWLPISPGQKLIALANWDTLDRCEVMRSYQNFLIALNVTKSGLKYPTMFKWSHPADPGSVPSTWNPSDATKLAGELPLSDTDGFIVDGLTLGQSFMVYKEDAVIRMDRINTNDIFVPRNVSGITGIMAQECMKEFQPNRHVFLTSDVDVVVTDGSSLVSVLDEKNRKYLEQRIDRVSSSHCFLVVNQRMKEVYVCYPTAASEPYCGEAAVWNWKNSTWSFREITPTYDIKRGLLDASTVDETWDSDEQVWDDDESIWDDTESSRKRRGLVGAFPLVGELRQLDNGLANAGRVSHVERLGLTIVGQGRDGSPRNDPASVKMITEIWPLIEGGDGALLKVSVAAQDRPEGPVSWDGPYYYDPASMEKIDCLIEGKYIGVKFESDSQVDWKAVGYGMQLDVVGEYY